MNILKSANNFNSVGNLILSNVDIKPQLSIKVIDDKNAKPQGKEIKLETGAASLERL
jgi:hypothetical protein